MGTDMAVLLKAGSHGGKGRIPPDAGSRNRAEAPSGSKWRFQSSQFRDAIRQAKLYARMTSFSQPSSSRGSANARSGPPPSYNAKGNTNALKPSVTNPFESLRQLKKSQKESREHLPPLRNSGKASGSLRGSAILSTSTDDILNGFGSAPSIDPSYIQCPHCMQLSDVFPEINDGCIGLRRFNERAAERHIPKV